MKACSKCKRQLENAKFWRDASRPDGLNCQCIECMRERKKLWREGKADYIRTANKRYKTEKPWVRKAYKTRRERGVPIVPWHDPAAVARIYRQAHEWNQQNPDTPVQVDHIVPLKSPFVCGLHTHHNLQVLSSAVNAVKSNSYWPGMWNYGDFLDEITPEWLALASSG